MDLVLIDDMGKFVVKCLNDEFEFVHNTVDGSNWFNQKTLASIFGVSVVNISRLLNTYSKRINASNDFLTKPLKVHIRLKTNESNQRIKFYNFKAVSYLAHRIDTVEALNMLEWIDSSLNTMFNVATGQLDIDSKLEKLRNMQEVEEFKSNAYLNGYNALISIDKERANELYHLHKVHHHNALNCYDLLVSKNDWNDRYETVNRQINGKIDNTKQLTF